MCCMLTTFLVSSRILAKHSEHPLTFLKMLSVGDGDGGIITNYTIPIFKVFYQNFVFYVSFLLFCIIPIFIP